MNSLSEGKLTRENVCSSSKSDIAKDAIEKQRDAETPSGVKNSINDASKNDLRTLREQQMRAKSILDIAERLLRKMNNEEKGGADGSIPNKNPEDFKAGAGQAENTKLQRETMIEMAQKMKSKSDTLKITSDWILRTIKDWDDFHIDHMLDLVKGKAFKTLREKGIEPDRLDTASLVDELCKQIDLPRDTIEIFCAPRQARTVTQRDAALAVLFEPDPQTKEELLEVYQFLFDGEPDTTEYDAIMSVMSEGL